MIGVFVGDDNRRDVIGDDEIIGEATGIDHQDFAGYFKRKTGVFVLCQFHRLCLLKPLRVGGPCFNNLWGDYD